MNEKALEKEYLEISAIQEDEQEALLNKQNVVGIGVGQKIKGEKETGDPCLSVFVSQKLETDLIKVSDMIPKSVGKYKTDVVETGEIFAGGVNQEADLPLANIEEQVGIETLRGRRRPAMGGYSVGHYGITAGTIATCAYDKNYFPGVPRKYYILSNNHVLANSNACRIGDPILQPGNYDGGKMPADIIARLSRYIPIRFGGQCNYVDAAIAEGNFHDLNREIYWIGYIKGIALVRPGYIVQKTGRTTSYTTGKVKYINATVNVNYGSGKVAKMCRQIITTNMSAGGDSGSLTCDMNERAVGLLFAGSSSITIHNDIRYVLHLLNIKID